MTNIRNHIDRVLFPEVCFGCNAQLFGGENLLCTICRNDLPLTEFNFRENNIIDRTFYGRIAIEKANSFLYFRQNGIVKNLLHALKYKNQEQIGAFLGDWFGHIISMEDKNLNVDFVVPVPLHPAKLKQRGYNQVSLFAEKLASHIEGEYLPNALIKTANVKTQTKKGRFLRWSQTQELYKVNPLMNLQGKSILLVDDVITTGATIESCAKSLLQHKQTKVYVATMAIVPKLGN
ncbi:ComF family protein [Croceivirga thetidis]|uniref:ComF family protein n=1 Tax=Croceivirga thetidis TaxID=2721623 RepID=UPI001FF0C155|nr:ComF family protein [Croceivirga thetidis]